MISTCPPHGVYGYEAGKRWRALNILEELDEPGEYYVDRSTGTLYFYPPSAESLPVLEDPLLHHTGIRPVYPPSPVRERTAYVSMLEDPLVHLNGASHVMLRGLTFEVCRGVGIRLDGGTGNTIAGCTVRNIGTNAVEIRGGTDNGILSCDIYEAGDTAITLAGGDRKTLTPGGNYAVNNHIHDFSRWCRTYRPALSISGVGQRAAHNYIHSAPHMGIACHGNEHIIEYNEIHSILYETGDAGAYYMGRDWSQRGNIVRFNFIHHLGSFDDKFSRHGFSETMAVYLDDWTSDTLVYGNVCYKANRAVLVGGGRDNTIENNIFIDCKPAIHVDARGLGWAKNYFDGTTTTLFDRLEAVNYSQPPYSEKYPELLTLLDDESAVPKYNRILRNICVGGKWLDLHGDIESVIEVEDNLVDQDPMFVDAEKMDFTVKSGSPALKLGFKQIPMDKIGLYVDDYRRTLPEAGFAPQAR